MEPAREDLLERARAAARALGRQTITATEFSVHSGISKHQIYQHFEGFRDFFRQAGLVPNEQNVRLDDDAVFREMAETFKGLGGIVTRTRFAKSLPFSVDVLKKRGLNWPAALAALRGWLEVHDPSFPYLSQLKEAAPPPRAEPRSGRPLASDPRRSWSSRGGRVFGEVINFRGLLHAPVNEQGVVFLFALVAHELDYVVESVASEFPDCEAKRRVGKGRLERVRVEFEYQSRTPDRNG